MIIEDLPSRVTAAKKRSSEGDVYLYDHIPSRLTNQIVRLWFKYIGNISKHHPEDHDFQRIDSKFRVLSSILRDEYGAHKLHQDCTYLGYHSNQVELIKFFESTKVLDEKLDVILLSSRFICNNYQANADEYKDILNQRFLDNNIGYRFENQSLIRIDSTIQHAEIVKPALKLLNSESYQGAEVEYLKAHEHYRKGDYEGALTESLKAFESTMKVVCKKQGWSFTDKDNASKLIDICFGKNLLDSYWKSHFTALASVLKSGVPTARNKISAHGRGTTDRQVPSHIASFIVHSTASNIILLINAEDSI